ncbi:ElaA protein [Aeromicrobium panaciterrae]|uniref:ElaA protein n=1 Tax=Aeromicrobium panaciterrae TaxID=363861 RepID=A0ABU1UQJ6_9ACTN|nr:GNAT family N-acetyltransferase [Aeromicrobium panaciterrae]MDR7087461.1 ElaA protein [Aeromicrobium panaciterrae]
MSERQRAHQGHCRTATGDTLTAQDVYDIWKIRDAVFAFEQHVEDTDPDGRDLLPTTTHMWLADHQGPTSYLRVLDDGHVHLGRVCTRQDQRGLGLAGQLMAEATRLWGDREIALNAQSHLERWYESFGYMRSGEDFDEAGIQHTPMVRPAP